MNTYGVRISLALAVIFVPASQAYLFFGTVEGYPYLLTLTIGAAMGVALAAVREPKSSSSARTKSERPEGDFENRQVRWCLRHLGPPFWTFALALIANRSMDDSPAMDHEVRLSKFVTNAKGPSVLVVDSWNEPDQSQSLRYDFRTMPEIGPASPAQQRLVVTTRRGALGWEWVQSVRPATR
ncbi:MAG: hypothetical protein QM784_32760 [Polyangiaceae bacterium]